jgi:4-carboxymuconolactone decarboxylase
MSQPRRFGPLPLEAMTPDQRAIAESILAGPRGASTGLRGPFESFLRSPGMAGPAEKLGEHVRFHSSIPAALNEMAILVVARRWTSQFEWYSHRQLAEAAGLSPAVVDAISSGRRPDLDGDGDAVYDFAAELLVRGGVSDTTWTGVVDRWGQQGAMDLVALVGYYTLVSFTLNVDRYPVPGDDEPLTAL